MFAGLTPNLKEPLPGTYYSTDGSVKVCPPGYYCPGKLGRFVLLELIKQQMEQVPLLRASCAARGNIPLDQGRLRKQNAIYVRQANTNPAWGSQIACRVQLENSLVV